MILSCCIYPSLFVLKECNEACPSFLIRPKVKPLATSTFGAVAQSMMSKIQQVIL